MKRVLLVTLLGLTVVTTSLFAQTSQILSISGPSGWVPGTTVTLSVQDTFSGYPTSYGLSYWLMVSNAIAPSLTITSVTYFTFPYGNNIGTFPFSFNSTSGADAGFMTTTTANGQSGDLGATGDTSMQPPPPGVPLHVTDITFAVAANAPIGTYTLRTTTASPRVSIQVDELFGDHAIPQASFVFSVVPEPSTLALLAMVAVGTGAVAYRRRNRRQR